jgi:ABC-type transporter Mla MlaB component
MRAFRDEFPPADPSNPDEVPDWRSTVPTRDERPPLTTGEHESPPPSGTSILMLGPTITRARIPALCEELLVLLSDSDTAVVVCDVGAIAAPDAAAIEALARLQLTARRLGRSIRVQRAGRDLRDLLALTGLHDVLPLSPD